MKVTVASGKGGARQEILDLANNATLDDLKRAYRPKVSVHRKSFKMPGPEPAPAPKDGQPARPNLVTLNQKGTLAEQGVKDGMVLQYKDLGPQVGYRTVFLVEYGGPIALILLYAMRPSFIYGASTKAGFGYAQKLFVTLFTAHFVKRELETVLVHKFSRPTMPMRNIFKNCIYYWSFAAFIGYVLCSDKYTEPNRTQAHVGAIIMLVSELLNFAVHMQLSLMRKGDGDQARNVPTGPLFALVSCPNYFFEVMSWVGFSIGTNIVSSWLFTAAGLYQMAEWALKKHSGYVKVDPKNKQKKAILPYLL